MDLSDHDPSEFNWLDKMKGYLIWTVRGPDLHNPFLPPISDQALINMLENPAVLNEHIELKCSCDGHEVFVLKNLTKPNIRAEHPCVKALRTADIITAINRLGVLEDLAGELQKIQRAVLQEVRNRQQAKKTVNSSTSGKTLKEIRKDNKEARQLQEARLNSAVLSVPGLTLKSKE